MFEDDGYSESFTYDPVGNMVEKVLNGTKIAMTYDAANELKTMESSQGKLTYAYDLNGNLTQKTLGDRTDTYSYDARNRLKQYRGYDNYQVKYSYNALGMLHARESSGNHSRTTLEELIAGKEDSDDPDGNDGSHITTYTYDLTQPYYQVLTETADGVTTSYTYGLERLAAYTDETRTAYLYDGRGSVIQTISSLGTQTMAYSAYGELLTEKTSGYGYNGEYYDAATGMLNLRARQYEPAQGRFSQRDSLKGWATSPRSLNAYLYCQNDAINFFDASGAAMVAVNMTDGGGGRKSDTSPSSFFRKVGQTIKSVVSAAASAAAVAKAVNDQALKKGLVNSILKERNNPATVIQQARANRVQAQASTPTVRASSFLRSTPLTACMTQEEYVDYWATAGASGQNGGWNTWGSLLYPGEIHNAVTKHLSEKHGLTREKWFSSEEALYRLDLYSPISNEYWEVKPVSYISSKTLRCSILDPQMAKYDEFAVRGTPLGNDEFPYKNYDVYTYSFEPGIVYYKFIKREQQVPTYAFAPEPETEKQRESAYDNNGSTRGRKVAPVVYILAGGIIIVGTLFEDAWTLGAGIADDPITLSAGAAMVREGLKELWPILAN